MRGINWESIFSQGTPQAFERKALEELDAALAADGTVNLCDCHLYSQRGGQVILTALDNRQRDPSADETTRGKWRLRILRNPDGTTPKPGDKFRWIAGEKADFVGRDGKKHPMNTREKSRLMRMCRRPGDQWDVRIWKERTIGPDGCIRVGYLDAGDLLFMHGPLSTMPEQGDNIWHLLLEEAGPEETTTAAPVAATGTDDRRPRR